MQQVESEAMQFFRQAKAQFQDWLRDTPDDLEPGAIRRCIARCDEAMQELREAESKS